MSPLYKVRLSWGILVEAANIDECHKKAASMLKQSPEGFITGIESGTLARPRSLLGRIITGR